MMGTFLVAAACAFSTAIVIWLVIYSIDEFSNCKHFDTKKRKD